MAKKEMSARDRATKKYHEKNTELVVFRVRKGMKGKYAKLAEMEGKRSLSSFIIDTLEEKVRKAEAEGKIGQGGDRSGRNESASSHAIGED